MKTGGHAIQIDKTRGETGDIAIGMEQFLDAFQGGLQQGINFLGTTGFRALLGNLHDAMFRLINQLHGCPPLGAETTFRNLLGGRNQIAQGCPLFHNLGIGANIGGTGCVAGQLCKIREPTRGIQLAVGRQLISHGNNIHRLSGLGQFGDLPEYQAVVRAVEICGGYFLSD